MAAAKCRAERGRKPAPKEVRPRQGAPPQPPEADRPQVQVTPRSHAPSPFFELTHYRHPGSDATGASERDVAVIGLVDVAHRLEAVGHVLRQVGVLVAPVFRRCTAIRSPLLSRKSSTMRSPPRAWILRPIWHSGNIETSS